MEAGLERVGGWLDAATLLHPVDAGTPSLVDLACAVARWTGATVPQTAHSAAIDRIIGEWQHLVLVLVDGLGMNLLDALPQASFLRGRLAGELRTVYPSSTAPALVSLTTTRWPAEHAITGWWTHLARQRLTSTILPFTERRSERPLRDFGVDPDAAFPLRPAPPADTVDVAAYLPRAIADTTASRYLNGGGARVAYSSLSAAAGAIGERIKVSRARTYTYWYIPFVDAAEHEHGPLHAQPLRAAGKVAEAVAQLASRAGTAARILVTADHGLIAAQPRAVHVLEEGDELLGLLMVPPSAEPRAPAFHVRQGCADEFTACFEDRFGESFALLTPDDAASLGLFGPATLTEETRARLGDFVGVTSGPDVLLYDPKAELRKMRGFHGGMTADEMRIPLIVA